MKETSQVIREHATDDPVRKCADLGPIRFNGAHGSKMPIESDRGRFDSVDLSAIPPPPPPQESFKLRESMGIHVVALAKLNHLIFASRSSSPAAVSCLVWPFLLRLATSCDRVRRGYSDAVYASRLFLFQLRRIVLPGGGDGDGRDIAAGTRWERALRLVCRRLIGGWQSTVVLVDEDSFHTLSMLAL